MINLNDHVVVRQGIEYVPLEIAQAAVDEIYTFKQYNREIEQTMSELKNVVENMDLNINLEDD